MRTYEKPVILHVGVLKQFAGSPVNQRIRARDVSEAEFEDRFLDDVSFY